MNISLAIFFNFILSWFFTKLFIKPFKKFIPDIPNERSSHKFIKPRGGGLSFILANIIVSNIFEQVNFVFLLPLSLTGFIDDFFNISRFSRLFIQIATSSFIVFNSKYTNFLQINNDLSLEDLFGPANNYYPNNRRNRRNRRNNNRNNRNQHNNNRRNNMPRWWNW